MIISPQPIHLQRYLSRKKRITLPKVKRLFYLSWEDALWDLLKKKHVPVGSVILVPEFFCGDVEDNMRAHGYTVQYYPVSKKLQTAEIDIAQAIRRWQPSTVIVFHALGIQNSLLCNGSISWLGALSQECILIEDCVHRVIDPSRIHFVRRNHFMLDSLRKVVPIQGSFLYGNSLDLPFYEPPLFQFFFTHVVLHHYGLRW